jgi:hypothetical protein
MLQRMSGVSALVDTKPPVKSSPRAFHSDCRLGAVLLHPYGVYAVSTGLSWIRIVCLGRP